MKKLILIILFLLPISICSFLLKKKAVFFSEKPKHNTVIINVKEKNLYLDLENYVIGVVAGEMPALFQDEALKAQAVAARSYVLSKEKDGNYEVSASTSDQVFLTSYEMKEKWQNDYDEYYNKILNAVKKTTGEVLTKDNKILKAFYFSMSNGYTENSKDVFGEDLTQSVESPFEISLSNFEIVKEFSKSDLLEKLGVDNLNIENQQISETKHTSSIIIGGKEFSGIEVRKLLNLRSTDFEIKQVGENFNIITRGYGHGVGMSQYGANELAKSGKSYKEILAYYYKNTKLVNL